MTDQTFKQGRKAFSLTDAQIEARAQRRIACKGKEYGTLTSLLCCVGGTSLAAHQRFAESRKIPFYVGFGDVAKTVALINDKKPMGIVGVPGFLAALARTGQVTSKFAYVLCGGGSMSPDQAKEIQAGLLAPGGAAYIGYGASEVQSLTLGTFDQAIAMPGCVGAPCPGTQLDIRHGRIFAKTPVMIAGYYDARHSAAVIGKDGFIDTGDEGRMQDGLLILEKNSVAMRREMNNRLKKYKTTLKKVA